MISPGSASLVLLSPPSLAEIGVLPSVPRAFQQCPILAPAFRADAIRLLAAKQRWNGLPDTAEADVARVCRKRGSSLSNAWHELCDSPDWAPPHALQKAFPAATRVALCRSTGFTTDYDWAIGMVQSPLERAVSRAASSSWHWGYTKLGWDDARRFTQFLARLKFNDRHGKDEPRLTMTLETTRSEIGPRGRSSFTRGLYLDANLALLLQWEGRHVATISFAWVADTASTLPLLRIRQIQLVSAQGNRWAYHFGDCYFKALLSGMVLASDGLARVQLVRGEALVRLYVTDYVSRLRSLRARTWPLDAEDRKECATIPEKIRYYRNVLRPRLAKLYAKTPDGFGSVPRVGNYREFVPLAA